MSPLASDAGVPPWWEALFDSACNRSVFLSLAWMQSWLEVYQKDFEGQWIRWQRGGATVGGCLLLSRVTWKGGVPLRSLFINATGEGPQRTPLAEYNDILHVAGQEAAIATDMARILAGLRWSRLVCSGYQVRSLLGRVVSRLPAATVEHEPKPAPYVDLAALQARYETTLAGKGGSQIRRISRLHEKEYGPCRITPAASLEEARRFFDELMLLHRTSWESRGHSGSFASDAVRAFHHRLIGRLWHQRGVELIQVCNDNAVVGYLYNFTGEAKVYYFQSGFCYRNGSNLSPGLLAHCMAIEHYRQRGLREYDFRAGDVRYKRSLADECRVLHWTAVYRDRAWIRFFLWLRELRGRLRERANPVAPGGDS
jgi:CelD/BcsL family acetyltransferase involved in cellulose biosynthesis